MKLVGNVGNMLVCVTMTSTLSSKNWLMSNVANAMTGFKAGSRVADVLLAQLPSHIHDSYDHYSNGGNGRFLRKKWFVYMI